jgi:hypothetical protein
VYIGGGIFLLVFGAILAFAVRDGVSGIDTVMIGWICMGAGALSIVLSLVMLQQRANTRHTEVVERRNVGGTAPGGARRTEYVEEHRDVDGPY